MCQKLLREYRETSVKTGNKIVQEIMQNVANVFSFYLILAIKHGYSCINIRQVPREVWKTEAGGRGFQHLLRDLANVNELKNHVQSFRLFIDVSQMQFPQTMLVLGPGNTHLVMAANLWPPYEHTESYVAMH